MRALAVLFLVAACGGDDAPDADAGPPRDARHYTDADLVACTPGDADAGCDSETLTPVCDPGRGACVECTDDGDCDRDRAFGPDCAEAQGYCQCRSEADCEGNANGPRCHAESNACTCIDDDDCADDEDCAMEPYLGGSVRTCHRP